MNRLTVTNRAFLQVIHCYFSSLICKKQDKAVEIVCRGQLVLDLDNYNNDTKIGCILLK